MSYNPFSGWRVTGNWQDHMSYSLGGTDYPLPYGSALPAPAAGTLRTSGGSGERRAGEVGSAGRRSILDLDAPLGDMVSIVFQHQSRFGEHGKHYDERETLGWSGASANGRDWGGDVHLHIHGLDKHGNRVDYTTHISSSTAGEEITPIPEAPKPQEFGMAQRMFYARVTADGVDDNEWMLAGVDIPPHPTDPKQDGYRVTTDKEVAKRWARQYSFGPVGTKAVQLTRDPYIAQQKYAREDATEWRAGIKALFGV